MSYLQRAEVKRLRIMVEQGTTALNSSSAEIERLQEKIVNRDLLLDMHRAEIERLRAENKWLYEQMAAQKRTALDKEAEKPDGNPPL